MKVRDRVKELRRVKASDLIPNPKNWRKHPRAQADALRGVLAEIGYADALLARETPEGLMLVDGHLRAETTPDAEVPVLVLDVTEEEADKMLLTLDPLAGMAEMDGAAVNALLESVSTESEAVRNLLDGLRDQAQKAMGPGEGLTDPDDVPEAPEEPVAKRGDVWVCGDHRVMCGDSTDAEDVARLMAGEKADSIVTDPPYGIALDTDWSGIRRTGRSLGFKKAIKGKAYPRVVGDDTPFDPVPVLELWANGVDEVFLFGADYYAERVPSRSEGSFLVWDKRKETQADGFGSEFELIWSRQRHKRRILRHEWFGFLRAGEHGERRSHPTQKPIVLIEDIMSQWCGQMIADPFLGSGTTMIAAERLGRRCFGMELEPRYVDVAVRRWEEFTGREAMREGKQADA